MGIDTNSLRNTTVPTQRPHNGSPTLSFEDEFAVFNLADLHDVFDERGWLYGVRRLDEGLADVGTRGEQMAEFPLSRVGAWHGYPNWPVTLRRADSFRSEKRRPQTVVFDRLVQAGLLNLRQRKRLSKGRHA